MPINKQFKRIVEEIKEQYSLTQKEISAKLGIKETYLSDMINGRVPLTQNITESIYELFHIRIEDSNSKNSDRNLIPFYDDVATIGGLRDQIAEPGTVYKPSDYIDTGDWFRDATAALRHYGESMEEYPSGCILALKEVKDRTLIVWGKDYVIETSEYRITKRLQTGKNEEYVRAYSSNKTIYPDGQLVHEPVDIPCAAIKRLYLVLGYVVKKNGGMMVFANKE